jgi:hypothetical protein
VLLEDAHEQLADDLALGLRLGDPGELLEVAGAGVTWMSSMPMLRLNVSTTWSLSLSASGRCRRRCSELVADGLVHERRGDRGVDAAD